MKTNHLRPAPGTETTTTTEGRCTITRWTTTRGVIIAAMPNEFGEWDIWTEKLVEVEDGESEIETGQIARDVDMVTAEELEAMIG